MEALSGRVRDRTAEDSASIGCDRWGSAVDLRARLILHVVAAALAVLVWAPLVLPGHVLAYDMIFVPHQPFRWDLVAPSAALPRAVPQDAVVAAANQLIPGWLLQRLVLVSLVWAAAVGAGRLVPTDRLPIRLVAAVGYAWTPFVAERLLLGQWGLLVAYAAMPWLVAAALGLRVGRPGSLPRLLMAAAAAAVTPTGGVIALATVAVLVPDRHRRAVRSGVVALTGVAALNAPWVVAALLASASGRSDPTGVAAFAARAENWAGPLVALAGTGGMWNSLATPASRASALVPAATVVLVSVALVGMLGLRRRWPASSVDRLGLLAVGGFLVAALGVLPPGRVVLAWLVVHAPGAGLLRDGHKFLIPYALLLALSAALGAERLARLLTGRFGAAVGRGLVVGLALLPLAVLPDLALGVGGRLRPVPYPDEWDTVAAHVARAPGEVLSLPFEQYQGYRWNRGQVVIDPAPRYLSSPVLHDDTLRVGDLVVAGENPRSRQVRELLRASEPASVTGVRWVLVRREPGRPVAPETLAGLRPVHDGNHLGLYENPAWTAHPAAGAQGGVVAAHLLALAVFVVGFVALCRPTRPW